MEIYCKCYYFNIEKDDIFCNIISWGFVSGCCSKFFVFIFFIKVKVFGNVCYFKFKLSKIEIIY